MDRIMDIIRVERVKNSMKTLENAPFIAMFILTLTVLSPLSLSAQMSEVSDDELSAISAQAGISTNLGMHVNITTSSIRISDTDHDPKNWIELNNFSLSGPDGYADLTSPLYSPNYIDVGTMTTIDGQTRTLMEYQLSDHTNTRIWSIGNFVFCNQDLGSIVFDTSTVVPAHFGVSSHPGADTSGLEFEYLTSWLTNDFTYTYNTGGGTLNLQGIHLAESVVGAPESDPSTWVFSGQFRIGDLLGGNINAEPSPATMDVATDTSTETSTTAIYINLPMKGTVRVADVVFGGNNFGPVAIDGITVHHLGLKFNPGN
jgi:hypothetical protein